MAEIESDRLLSAQRLVKRYGGVVVLKGAGTIIAAEHHPLAIIDAGNAGMASGGMGDVLSGIIGALLGQKFTPYDAACVGMCGSRRGGGLTGSALWRSRHVGDRSFYYAAAYC
ncbi:carbohydrate kinase [Salmonella enterica subsp. enterica]|uniref:Carbohydrate kinase n=1 Tax=Salmonella enterica I TaxID=59201 RepID=A0A447PPV2_SALET|nr:carbohydrate kinase [Salmonella enterica subsp. enterica]